MLLHIPLNNYIYCLYYYIYYDISYTIMRFYIQLLPGSFWEASGNFWECCKTLCIHAHGLKSSDFRKQARIVRPCPRIKRFGFQETGPPDETSYSAHGLNKSDYGTKAPQSKTSFRVGVLISGKRPNDYVSLGSTVF